MYVTEFNHLISLNIDSNGYEHKGDMVKNVSVHNLMVTEIRVANLYTSHMASHA